MLALGTRATYIIIVCAAVLIIFSYVSLMHREDKQAPQEIIFRILSEQDERLARIERHLRDKSGFEVERKFNKILEGNPTEIPVTKQKKGPKSARYEADLLWKPPLLAIELFGEMENMPFDTKPVVDLNSEEKKKVDKIFRRLQYWKRSEEPHQPIIPRFLTWKVHDSGFNNRRMSLEVAWAMALALNRTFVLHPPEHLVPFREIGYDEKFWDIDAMKRVWPTLTYKEFIELPNYKKVVTDVLYLNWTDIPTSDSVFAFPVPAREGTPEFQDWKEWRSPRIPTVPPESNRIYSLDEDVPGNDHVLTVFLNTVLFTHYHILIYPHPSSGMKLETFNKHVRDGVRFREEIFWIAAKILKEMPNKFSTIHFRRGDLDYATRKVAVNSVLENVRNILLDGEHVYVSTDEKPEVFNADFVPVWEKQGYAVLSFQNYQHLIPADTDPKWIPLIETVIASNGRIFVGTHYSTFTNYVHRLRGHLKHIKNKNFYYTDKTYNSYDDHQSVDYYSWDREFPRSWLVDDNDEEK